MSETCYFWFSHIFINKLSDFLKIRRSVVKSDFHFEFMSPSKHTPRQKLFCFLLQEDLAHISIHLHYVYVNFVQNCFYAGLKYKSRGTMQSFKEE